MKNTLWHLPPGGRGRINELRLSGAMARRLTELGFMEGETARKLLQNRSMAAYLIQGTVIALRRGDAMKIIAEEVAEWD